MPQKTWRPNSFLMTLSVLAALAAAGARCITSETATAKADAASAKALASHSEALIARLKLGIDKDSRELYGSRSEHRARLLEQMEMRLQELEADTGGGAIYSIKSGRYSMATVAN
jgi:hypothetical protein